MTGRRKKPQAKTEAQANAFFDRLSEALDKLHQEEWLGLHSPLATPYFLGDFLLNQPAADTLKGRGRALQTLIRDCLSRLDPTDEECRLLRIVYLDPQPPSRQQIADKFHVSLSGYYRLLKSGTKTLAETIVKVVAPELRLERPPNSPELFERAGPRRLVTTALEGRHIVAITGPPGYGKTALASTIARHVYPANAFWHTCSTNQGDNLISFVFGLGHFLERKGLPDLWLYLIAEWREMNLADAAQQGSICAGIACAALRQLVGKPLICLDEADKLQPDEIAAHAQLLSFVQLLREDAHILLTGGPLALADISVPVTQLSAQSVHALIVRVYPDVRSSDISALMQLTRGSPRLVQLIATWLKLGETIESVLEGPNLSASLDGLFQRIWQRLNDAEKRIVHMLAVLRKPAARDIWLGEIDAPHLLHLIELRLIVEDDAGGVILTPAYQRTVIAMSDEDVREHAHLTIASVLADYGQYTEAVYHYIKAHQPAIALYLWNENKTSQLNQGQAGPALRIFREIANSQVSTTEHDLLHMLRAEMARTTGDYVYAEHELSRVHVADDSALAVPLLLQKGTIYYLRDQAERALIEYRRALTISEAKWQVLQRLPMTRADIARSLLLGAPKLQAAWEQTQIAHHEVEFLQGLVMELSRRYHEAIPHYRAAIEIAISILYLEGEAQARANLAATYAAIGANSESLLEIEMNLKRAIDIYEQTGRQSQIAAKLNDVAMVLNLAGQHERALPYAQRALERARILNWPSVIAAAAQSLAEAELALGNLDGAEAAAYVVINTDEPHILPDGLRALGEVHLARGDTVTAERLIRQSIQEAANHSDWYLEAYGWRALGRCLFQLGDLMQAGKAFETAATFFRDNGLIEELHRTEVEQKNIHSKES